MSLGIEGAGTLQIDREEGAVSEKDRMRMINNKVESEREMEKYRG